MQNRKKIDIIDATVLVMIAVILVGLACSTINKQYNEIQELKQENKVLKVRSENQYKIIKETLTSKEALEYHEKMVSNINK